MQIDDKEIKFFWHDSEDEPISDWFNTIEDAVEWFETDSRFNDWNLGFISEPGERLPRLTVLKVVRLINNAKKQYIEGRKYIN